MLNATIPELALVLIRFPNSFSFTFKALIALFKLRVAAFTFTCVAFVFAYTAFALFNTVCNWAMVSAVYKSASAIFDSAVVIACCNASLFTSSDNSALVKRTSAAAQIK